jgi:site-specific DNA-methyltransferase (adenine-specific)
MKITEKINVYNCDNMEFMKNIPDNYYDLAIVDPPYKNDFKIVANGKAAKVKKNYNLDTLNGQPKKKYFDELIRVSKNQIIWGINYYPFYFGAGRLVWDKDNTGVYSDCELAFHSFSDVTRKFKFRWNGMLQQDMKNKETRIHPTQKPAALYKWILDKYAKEGDKILDTHLGSMSIAIACHDYGFYLDGCEIDKEYFDKGVQRILNHVSQQKLF